MKEFPTVKLVACFLLTIQISLIITFTKIIFDGKDVGLLAVIIIILAISGILNLRVISA